MAMDKGLQIHQKINMTFLKMLILLLGIFLSSCQGDIGSSGEGAQQPQEPFEFSVFSAQEIYKTTDSINIWATLKYLGNDRYIKVWHGEPIILFSITDGKDIKLGGVRFLTKTSSILKRDKLYTYECSSILLDGNDPIVDYLNEANLEKGLFLPPGEYEVEAVGAFSLNDEDTTDIGLSAKTRFKVINP